MRRQFLEKVIRRGGYETHTHRYTVRKIDFPVEMYVIDRVDLRTGKLEKQIAKYGIREGRWIR